MDLLVWSWRSLGKSLFSKPHTSTTMGIIVLIGLLVGLVDGLSYWLLAGLSAGLLVGLLKGGLASLRHYVLRFLLWRTGSVPWHYVPFLDYAAERILLRKVGGGYIFIHRLLLDYFALLETPFPEEAPAVSVISDPLPAISSAPQIDTAH